MPDARFDQIGNDPRAAVEFQKLRLEFAWRHFEFHARQRTIMFNFFILLLPLLLAGFFYFVKDGSIQTTNNPRFATLVAVIGAILSGIFGLLDVRNRQLYQVSQDNLRLLENDFLYAQEYSPLRYKTKLGDEVRFHGIITEEQARYGQGTYNSIVKHKFLMPALYMLAFLVFVFLGLCLHVKWL